MKKSELINVIASRVAMRMKGPVSIESIRQLTNLVVQSANKLGIIMVSTFDSPYPKELDEYGLDDEDHDNNSGGCGAV